jgi:hypothetical protein
MRRELPRLTVTSVMHDSHEHISSKSRFPLPRLLPRRNTFTAEEVRRRLRLELADDPRTAAVHSAAARTAVWSSRLPRGAAAELGRAASRLPTIVYWYRQGVPAHEIGRRLSPFGSAWDANRAMEVASALIADVLNRGDVPEIAA